MQLSNFFRRLRAKVLLGGGKLNWEAGLLFMLITSNLQSTLAWWTSPPRWHVLNLKVGKGAKRHSCWVAWIWAECWETIFAYLEVIRSQSITDHVYEIMVKTKLINPNIEQTPFQLRPILLGLRARVCHWADRRGWKAIYTKSYYFFSRHYEGF